MKAKKAVQKSYPQARCNFSAVTGTYCVSSGTKRHAVIGSGKTSLDAWRSALNWIEGGEKAPPAVVMKEYGTMDDKRKTLPQLKAEYDTHRRMLNRTFSHIGTGDLYSLIGIAFDEATNEAKAVYCVASTPWLKFVRPMDEFVDKFKDLGDLR